MALGDFDYLHRAIVSLFEFTLNPDVDYAIRLFIIDRFVIIVVFFHEQKQKHDFSYWELCLANLQFNNSQSSYVIL